MTVVEAGLLAKFGMNSAGLVVATNALVSGTDVGRTGVPYHVMLRALLDCRTPTEAATLLQSAPRSSSANYVIGSGDGLVVDAEARPGGFDAISWELPDDRGLLLHTNHFSVAPLRDLGGTDVGLMLMADSLFRLQRIRDLLRANPNPEVGRLAAHPLRPRGQPRRNLLPPRPGGAAARPVDDGDRCRVRTGQPPRAHLGRQPLRGALDCP